MSPIPAMVAMLILASTVEVGNGYEEDTLLHYLRIIANNMQNQTALMKMKLDKKTHKGMKFKGKQRISPVTSVQVFTLMIYVDTCSHLYIWGYM